MPKKYKLKSLYDYINALENKMEKYEFDHPQDAYDFGKKIRQIEVNEEKVENEFFIKKIEVDISGNTVRIKIRADEPICVGTGCK